MAAPDSMVNELAAAVLSSREPVYIVGDAHSLAQAIWDAINLWVEKHAKGAA